jgi:hypothetical protein
MLTEGGASGNEPTPEARPEAEASAEPDESAAVPPVDPAGNEPEQPVTESAPPELSAEGVNAQTSSAVLQDEPEPESAEVVAAS